MSWSAAWSRRARHGHASRPSASDPRQPQARRNSRPAPRRDIRREGQENGRAGRDDPRNGHDRRRYRARRPRRAGTGRRHARPRGAAALGPVLAPASPTGRLRVGLRRLFYGRRPAAVRFQIGLLALDLAAIAYFLATTFVAAAPWLRAADLLLEVLLACEFLGRMLAHREPMHHL